MERLDAGLGGLRSGQGFPAMYLSAGTSSFNEFLSYVMPDLLPGKRTLPSGSLADVAPHATTIVALTYGDGVVMAGDRRATMGNLIAQRDAEKVFAADEFSLIGVAGSMGVGMEVVRLFQMELLHYEKIEGTSLTLKGKVNRLASMIRGNLAAAMQGLAALPLFAGYDTEAGESGTGRIFSYDVIGSYNEEPHFQAIGSGSLFAKSALKKRWRPQASEAEAVRMAVDSLYDAGEDDSATSGVDNIRQLYPVVRVVTAEGTRRLTDDEVGAVAESIIAERRENPGG